jgi:hypothetical protein
MRLKQYFMYAKLYVKAFMKNIRKKCVFRIKKFGFEIRVMVPASSHTKDIRI